MRIAKIFADDCEAGLLTEVLAGKKYLFEYLKGYSNSPVSLSMPLSQRVFEYDTFPPFFDGLLPEGYQLDGLLKFRKIDAGDLFSQLIAVGDDMVGNITVKEITT